jgi:hypothetical protein
MCVRRETGEEAAVGLDRLNKFPRCTCCVALGGRIGGLHVRGLGEKGGEMMHVISIHVPFQGSDSGATMGPW